jgi:short-subunit dehydrogenase
MQQLAVITGASKGIGKALAFKFASGGFSIVLNAREEENLTRLASEITTAYPNIRVHFRPTDVSDEKDIKDFASFVQAINHPVSVLINNAGIFLPGAIHEEAEGNLRKMMDTNLYSAYHLTRALVPDMKKRREGHIFNVCSTASLQCWE